MEKRRQIVQVTQSVSGENPGDMIVGHHLTWVALSTVVDEVNVLAASVFFRLVSNDILSELLIYNQTFSRARTSRTKKKLLSIL
jgi:hypothetical protein